MAKKKPRIPQTKGRRPLPKCKALLLCDQTIRDERSRKVSLIGTFTHFRCATFPGRTSNFSAYLQLVDGIGEYEIMVEVHDLQEDQVIAKAIVPRLTFSERPSRVEVVIPVPNLPLAHPGSFDFVVFADGRELERQQFTAVQVEQ